MKKSSKSKRRSRSRRSAESLRDVDIDFTVKFYGDKDSEKVTSAIIKKNYKRIEQWFKRYGKNILKAKNFVVEYDYKNVFCIEFKTKNKYTREDLKKLANPDKSGRHPLKLPNYGEYEVVGKLKTVYSK